jgi:hypothetical protein
LFIFVKNQVRQQRGDDAREDHAVEYLAAAD